MLRNDSQNSQQTGGNIDSSQDTDHNYSGLGYDGIIMKMATEYKESLDERYKYIQEKEDLIESIFNENRELTDKYMKITEEFVSQNNRIKFLTDKLIAVMERVDEK